MIECIGVRVRNSRAVSRCGAYKIGAQRSVAGAQVKYIAAL